MTWTRHGCSSDSIGGLHLIPLEIDPGDDDNEETSPVVQLP